MPQPELPRGEHPAPGTPLRARFAGAVGVWLGGLSRAAGQGSGSVIGGHAILAIEPRALARFAAGREVALVSGTNGKTTTTKLLARALGAATGQEVVTNPEGANLPAGLAAALAGGRPGAPAALEVDEAWLGRVAAEVKPGALVLLNLSRDQLDRNNEVRLVAERWRQACQSLPAGAVVVANADDPLVAWAGSAGRRVIWAGAGLAWKDDAAGCPQCGGQVTFLDGADRNGAGWKCRECGFARPQPDIWLEDPGPDGSAVLSSGERRALHLELPGRCNQANAVTALATVLALGHSPEAALAAMAKVSEVGGRYATMGVAGVEARLLLAKNPAGWVEVFDMLAPAPGPVVVAINARTADGQDPSWLWDVPFERLGGRRVVATGERYLDLAVRLHYAGVEHVRERDLLRAVGAGGACAPGHDDPPGHAAAPGHGGAGPAPVPAARTKVDVVANYTAFHDLLARVRAGSRRR
ncbi:MAG: MurT ligase domain-containing protein [Acidimicrobiales bacterium]